MRTCLAKWLGMLVVGGVVAGAAASLACSTPTLPLPPPAALVACPPDVGGIVTVTGEALSGAFVFIQNERTRDGVIEEADATGRFTARIQANIGDSLLIWQQVGTDLGPMRTLIVPGPAMADGGTEPGCPP